MAGERIGAREIVRVHGLWGTEPKTAAEAALETLLDWLPWHGCMTGDCPHDRQSECDAALAGELRTALEHAAEIKKQRNTKPTERAPGERQS